MCQGEKIEKAILDACMIYQARRCIKINKWFEFAKWKKFKELQSFFFCSFLFWFFSLNMSHRLRHPKIHVRFEFSSRVILIWLTVRVWVPEEPAVEDVVGDVFDWRRRRRFWRRIVARRSGHALHETSGRFVVCRTTVAVRSSCHGWIKLIRVFCEKFGIISRCGVELRHVEELMNFWHDFLHWTLKAVNKFSLKMIQVFS